MQANRHHPPLHSHHNPHHHHSHNDSNRVSNKSSNSIRADRALRRVAMIWEHHRVKTVDVHKMRMSLKIATISHRIARKSKCQSHCSLNSSRHFCSQFSTRPHHHLHLNHQNQRLPLQRQHQLVRNSCHHQRRHQLRHLLGQHSMHSQIPQANRWPVQELVILAID